MSHISHLHAPVTPRTASPTESAPTTTADVKALLQEVVKDEYGSSSAVPPSLLALLGNSSGTASSGLKHPAEALGDKHRAGGKHHEDAKFSDKVPSLKDRLATGSLATGSLASGVAGVGGGGGTATAATTPGTTGTTSSVGSTASLPTPVGDDGTSGLLSTENNLQNQLTSLQSQANQAAASNTPLSESQLQNLDQQIQNVDEMMSMISDILKDIHDTKMTIINNMAQ